MFRPNLKAREYKKIEDIKYVQKTEASIGVQENLLRYLTILSGETFRRPLIER